MSCCHIHPFTSAASFVFADADICIIWHIRCNAEPLADPGFLKGASTHGGVCQPITWHNFADNCQKWKQNWTDLLHPPDPSQRMATCEIKSIRNQIFSDIGLGGDKGRLPCKVPACIRSWIVQAPTNTWILTDNRSAWDWCWTRSRTRPVWMNHYRCRCISWEKQCGHVIIYSSVTSLKKVVQYANTQGTSICFN